MKKTILCYMLSMACIVAFTNLSAQIQMPQASPSGSVSTTVGLTDVTIDYARPKVKGRKIFGDGSQFLQPYGELWRSGANEGSILTLSTDVMIAGTNVKAGKYLIFTVPGKDSWQFMLYNDLSIGGNTANYNKANEVLRVTVSPETLAKPVETLTYNIANISEDNTTADIQLAWENVAVNVPLTVSFDDIVMKDIQAKTQVNPNVYIQAANYYYETGKDLEQALKWMDMGIAANENAFWNVHIKAKILAKMGKKQEAIATANKSLELAKAAPSDFGYVKLNQDLIAEINK
jgi:tetratricopeptide (TPR) repeat protein